MAILSPWSVLPASLSLSLSIYLFQREGRECCELYTESFGPAFIVAQSTAFEYTNFVPRSVRISPNKFPCFRYVFARGSLDKHYWNMSE